MAYVRRRGNQLSIVAGERDPASRKVEQRVLFTLYSRAEALAMLGRAGAPESARRFEELLERTHPGVRFDWPALRAAVAADLDHLPERYTARGERPDGALRAEVSALVRGLFASPRGEVSQEERARLEVLRDLVAVRLAHAAPEPRAADEAGAPFRFAAPAEAPPEAEALAEGYLARGEVDRAEAAYATLAEAFPGSAGARVGLGRTALARGDGAAAAARFREAIEVARPRVPRRVKGDALQADPRGRPYARALEGLAVALVRSAAIEEARGAIDRLVAEVGDRPTASAARAALSMTTCDWGVAATHAGAAAAAEPAFHLLEAFAEHERGRPREAIAALLHGALAAPVTASRLTGAPPPPARPEAEAEERELGAAVIALLAPYLASRGAAVAARFARALADARVAKTIADVAALREAWRAGAIGKPGLAAELTRTQTAAFARTLLRRAPDLADG